MVIFSTTIRNFAIASLGNGLGLLISGSVGATLALYATSSLQMFGVHWLIRLLVVFVCVLVVQFAVAVFKYLTFQFRFDEHKISSKSGLLSQQELEFEWFSVRSFQVTQSLFQKRLNLASVTLVTAGSSDNTIEVPYVPYELALDWERRAKTQEIQDSEQAAEESETTASLADKEALQDEQTSEIIHRLKLRSLISASIAKGNVVHDAILGFVALGVVYYLYRLIY